MPKFKTLEGTWLTPLPVSFSQKDAESEGGVHVWETNRGHLRIEVVKQTIDLGERDGVPNMKVQRYITLKELIRISEDGEETEESNVVMYGLANLNYDRIRWNNGATWARSGTTKKDRDELAAQAKAREEAEKAARDAEEEARPEPEAIDVEVHGAPDDAAMPGGGGLFGCLCGASAKSKGTDPPAAAPVEHGEADPEVPAVTEAEGEAKEEEAKEEEKEPEDLSKGFFNDEDVDDIVDRINEVVGVWGISEEMEAEYIKPPVVMINKLIKVCMEGFLDNPIIDLFQYLMDETLDVMEKAKQIGNFLYEKMVKPLTAALVEKLEESFQAIAWIESQVHKVVLMMAQMVTDELVTKTVEQLQEADACS